jgi:hypothetical protein
VPDASRRVGTGIWSSRNHRYAVCGCTRFTRAHSASFTGSLKHTFAHRYSRHAEQFLTPGTFRLASRLCARFVRFGPGGSALAPITQTVSGTGGRNYPPPCPRGLARYQADLAGAAGKAQAAEGAVAAHKARVGQLEQARDTAAAVCASPPRIPYSLETISADPVRLAMSGMLDDVEMAMARFAVRALAMVTGADEAISDEARRQLLTEQEAGSPARNALWVGADGRGNITAIGNPGGHPDVPAQASPPGPNAGQGFSAPLFPGLGS